VRQVLVADVPWAAGTTPEQIRTRTLALADLLREGAYGEAVVFTSYHQSTLPTAMALRFAGIPRAVGTSDPDPGGLLDVRHRRMGGDVDDTGGPEGGHEVEAALAVAAAAGYPRPPGDDTRLRLRGPLPDVASLRPDRAYAVVHPGSAASARAIGPAQGRAFAEALQRAGWAVVVTGTEAERDLAQLATPSGGHCLAGRTSLAELAALLAHAEVLVSGNTGPAHLAAAVGTPVVSLFTPVVPVQRWGPWGVPRVILGDQSAPCAGSRARTCPVEGHPCLSSVTPEDVVAAARHLARGDSPRRRAS
jgi:ADP-heptose:LPS heptosyltransferase